MEKVQNVGTKSAFTPYLYWLHEFFFLKELITWVSLHNTHVLNYIRKKKIAYQTPKNILKLIFKVITKYQKMR